MLLQLSIPFLIFAIIWTSAIAQQSSDENCETLPFQLHLIKGTFFNILKVNEQHIFLNRGIRRVGKITTNL